MGKCRKRIGQPRKGAWARSRKNLKIKENMLEREEGTSNCELVSQITKHTQDDQTDNGEIWKWGDFLEDSDSGCIRDLDSSGNEVADSDGAFADEFFLIVFDKIIKYHSHQDVDQLVAALIADKYQIVYQNLKTSLPTQFQGNDNVESVKSVKKGDKESMRILFLYNNSEHLRIKAALYVHHDLSTSVFVHDKPVSADHTFWLGLPKKVFSAKDVQAVVDKLTNPWWTVCEGNKDKEFQNFVPENVPICNRQMTPIAYREENMGANYKSTIRTIKCELLVRNNQRCKHCKIYRKTLYKKLQREANVTNQNFADLPSLRARHSFMNKPQLINKLKQLQQREKSLCAQLKKARQDVLNEIKNKGHELNKTSNDDMIKLFNECQSDVKKAFPDDKSLPRILWEQQVQCTERNPNGVRWHPMIIKWCLYIHSISSKAYNAMREVGFLKLPSSRILFDYSHYLPGKNGFSTEVALHLKREAENLGMFTCGWKSYVGILQDEIQISQGLVYEKESGSLIGYVDLNETANQLENLHNSLNDSSPQIASNMLVLMVRGATTSLKYPLACFSTTGVTAECLYSIIWEAIKILESVCELKVIFVTCDGASPNRKFISYNKVEGEDFTYWCWNRYAFPCRKLYFISDVPHLIKTTRNCFANSHSHRKSRKLWKNGYEIKWTHIENLYEQHIEGQVYTEAHKLTSNHVHLTAFNQMKVNLAVQVLSKTVADSLEKNFGSEVIETVNFIRHMNRFFDCLNVRNLNEHIQKRNPDLREYTDVSDDRLKYLTEDFLGYFENWEKSVNESWPTLTKQEKNKLMLSHQTILGLKMSVLSICELVRFLLKESAPFVLTHHFNQDPIEEHFSHCRHKGGSNSNPTVKDFQNTSAKLKVISSTLLAPIRANITKYKKEVPECDFAPLSKRPKIKK